MMKRVYQKTVIQSKAKESCITPDETDRKPRCVVSDREDIYHHKEHILKVEYD